MADNLANFLGMDEFEQSLLAKSLLGKMKHNELINNIRTEIVTELLDLFIPEAKTQKDFLERFPGFCNYLYEDASNLEVTIEKFIEDKLPKIPVASGKNIMTLELGSRLMGAGKLKISSSMEEEILNTSFNSLKRAAEWYANELHRVAMTTQNLIDFNALMETEEQATTPDLDQLDKLMRYQTTLQRQLSTAMGELLELTR